MIGVPPAVPDADVLVVGAGLSAIDVAVRLGEKCPDLDYVVVEARDDLGGTWDLFRYPGVRSDSDFFTLAYPFTPGVDGTRSWVANRSANTSTTWFATTTSTAASGTGFECVPPTGRARRPAGG